MEVAHIRSEADACNRLIERCENGELQLVIPACCFTEAWHVWESDTGALRDHQNRLGQLKRTIRARAPYEKLSAQLTNIPTELIEIVEAEKDQVQNTQQRLADCATIVPLDKDALHQLLEFQSRALLAPHDAAVLASVIQFCKQSKDTSRKAFVTRDRKDFGKPDVEAILRSVSCEMFHSFEAASRLTD